MPIPLPNITKLNAVVGEQKSKNCSPESQERIAQGAARRAAKIWVKFAPTYRIQGVKLSELMQRPKNRQEDIDDANSTILRMHDIQPDTCSARFVDDESGKTLVCDFSHRMPATSKAQPNEQGKVEAKGDAKSPPQVSGHFLNK